MSALNCIVHLELEIALQKRHTTIQSKSQRQTAALHGDVVSSLAWQYSLTPSTVMIKSADSPQWTCGFV